MCEVQAGRRPRVLATDVILDVGTSLKVIGKSQLRLCQAMTSGFRPIGRLFAQK
jgi:hypothetical protein